MIQRQIQNGPVHDGGTYFTTSTLRHEDDDDDDYSNVSGLVASRDTTSSSGVVLLDDRNDDDNEHVDSSCAMKVCFCVVDDESLDMSYGGLRKGEILIADASHHCHHPLYPSIIVLLLHTKRKRTTTTTPARRNPLLWHVCGVFLQP